MRSKPNLWWEAAPHRRTPVSELPRRTGEAFACQHRENSDLPKNTLKKKTSHFEIPVARGQQWQVWEPHAASPRLFGRSDDCILRWTERVPHSGAVAVRVGFVGHSHWRASGITSEPAIGEALDWTVSCCLVQPELDPCDTTHARTHTHTAQHTRTHTSSHTHTYDFTPDVVHCGIRVSLKTRPALSSEPDRIFFACLRQ
jgi:hypothetical protein